MKKKLVVVAVAMLMLIAWVVSSYGAETVDIYSRETEETPDYFVKVTRPENDSETTFFKTYVIAGVTDYDNIVVEMLRYNKDKKRYESYANTDGKTSWEIGVSGMFAKEIKLSEGTNDIRLAIYKKGDKKKIQITEFSLTAMDREKLDDILDKNLINIFKPIIGGLGKT